MSSNLLRAIVGLAACALAAQAAGLPKFFARMEYGDGGGCAAARFKIADINGDGIPDIACTGGQFMFGNGNGTFRLSPTYAGLIGRDVAVLDLTGSGVNDLILLDMGQGKTFQSGVNVAFGAGDGTFPNTTFYPISDTLGYMAVGDFNGDGHPDVVASGYLGIWLLTGKGGGQFNAPLLIQEPNISNSYAVPLQAADLRGIGKLDIVISTLTGFDILFGNGDGTFQAPESHSTGTHFEDVWPFVADVNSDGLPDILALSPFSNDILIYYGKGGGALTSPQKVYLPGNTDVAVGDVNGDGIPDLVSDGVNVAYGLGGGKFSAPYYFQTANAEKAGAVSVTLAHLRNPKDLDIVLSGVSGLVSVLLNKGKETFIEGVTTALPGSIGQCSATADFNHDGIPDLAMVQNNNAVLVMLGTGNASAPFRVGPSSSVPPGNPLEEDCISLTAGDINGDGTPDLMLSVFPQGANPTMQTLIPLLGVGDGSFTQGPAIQYTTRQVGYIYLVDVNGDGKADYIARDSNLVAYGNGDGTFQAAVPFVPQVRSGTVPSFSSIAWADLNGDGKLDFVVSDGPNSETYILLSNPGSGGFTETMLQDPFANDAFAVGIGDLNGDGSPDLVLGDTIGHPVIYLNDGKGNFTYATELTMQAFAPYVVDLNGDGIPDIAGTGNGDIEIMANEGNLVFSNHELVGTASYIDILFSNQHGQSPQSGKPDMVLLNTNNTIQTLINLTK